MRESFEKWYRMAVESDCDFNRAVWRVEEYHTEVIEIAWQAFQAGFDLDLQAESA